MTNTTTTLRPNRYAGRCTYCGHQVPAGAGHLGPKQNGRYTVAHGNQTENGQACPGMIEDAPAAVVMAWAGHVTEPYRYAGMTWNQVAEANEYWDGEDEIRDAARRQWEAHSGMFCQRHGDSYGDGDTRCWECAVEADEAQRDYEDGMISTHKHGGYTQAQMDAAFRRSFRRPGL